MRQEQWSVIGACLLQTWQLVSLSYLSPLIISSDVAARRAVTKSGSRHVGVALLSDCYEYLGYTVLGSHGVLCFARQ